MMAQFHHYMVNVIPIKGNIMNFTASNEQLNQILANVVNASRPFGMGYLHYQEKDYTPDEMAKCRTSLGVENECLHLDYFAGRMVKLHFEKIGDNQWTVWPDAFHPEYNSFMHKYPTPSALIESVIPIPD